MPENKQVPPTYIPAPLPDDDAPMGNGEQAHNPPPASGAEENFGFALFQQLVHSNQRHDQILAAFMEERLRTQTTTTESKKSLAADPQQFDGSMGKLNEFLSDLRLSFLADPNRFNTDHKRIIFALSYMKGGSAHPWAMNVSDRYAKGETIWTSWKSFEEALRARFEMGDRKVEAQNVMQRLTQHGRPVEEFFDTFETNRPYSGLNDEACIQLLRDNLDLRLVNAIYSQNELPTNYHDWKELAIRKDLQLREAQTISSRCHGPGQWGFTKFVEGRHSFTES